MHVCQSSFVRFIYDMVIMESPHRLSIVFKKEVVYTDTHRDQAQGLCLG
jgi:hypothetical protein